MHEGALVLYLCILSHVRATAKAKNSQRQQLQVTFQLGTVDL